MQREVKPVATPRDQWVETYLKLGFSKPAAESFARMTGATVDGEIPTVSETEQGETSLETYIKALVKA